MRFLLLKLVLFPGLCLAVYFADAQYILKDISPLRTELNYDAVNKLIKSYEIVTVDTKNWVNNSYESSQNNTLNIAINGRNTEFVLEKTQLLSQDASIVLLTENGRTELNNLPEVISYKGYAKDQHSKIRLTVADGFLYGNIVTEQEEYFIEPVNYFLQSTPNDHYILYNKDNLLNSREGKQCFRPDIKDHELQKEVNPGNRNGVCYRARLAMLADYSMYTDPAHSGIQAVVNHIVGVLNNVEDNFEYNGSINFNDGVTFQISEMVISTCMTCDPISPHTNPGLLLTEFSSWIDQGGFNHAFHGAHLWTDRDLDGGTIGVAFQNSNLYCQSKGRALFQDWTTNASLLKIAVSHEVAHTFHAVHDASNSSTIMAPTISSPNTVWSNQTKTTVSGQIALQGPACLNACLSVPCSPVSNILIDDITNTHMHLSWAATTAGLYNIKVREVGQINFLMDFNTTSVNVSLAPPGYTVCKRYDILIYNHCAANGLSLPARLFVIAPTSQGCADFESNKTVIWPGIPVTFYDKSLNATSWLWNFGNGQTSTQQNPTVTYTSSGFYNVSLTVNGVNTKSQNAYIKVLNDMETPFTLAEGGNFESNGNYFASSKLEGTTDFWQLGTSNYILSTQGNAWKTYLNSDIPQVTNKSALYSPRFSFLGYQQFELHFDIGMEVAYCNAPIAGQIQYSINNGQTWSRLGNSPGFYNAGAGGNCKISQLIFPDTTGWTFNANYAHKSIDVSFLAGQSSVIFRFVLGVSGIFNGGYHVDGILMDNFRIDASGSVPLPLNVNSLSGMKKEETTLLQWNSYQPTDIDNYSVLHSNNGIQFDEVGIIMQENDFKLDFTYTHQYPVPGTNYYKIGAKNLDGKTTYTNVVKVDHAYNTALTSFPNPARNGTEVILKLENLIDLIQHIQFFDIIGRPVEVEYDLNKENQAMVKINQTGIYWYKCTTKEGNTIKGKIIVI